METQTLEKPVEEELGEALTSTGTDEGEAEAKPGTTPAKRPILKIGDREFFSKEDIDWNFVEKKIREQDGAIMNKSGAFKSLKAQYDGLAKLKTEYEVAVKVNQIILDMGQKHPGFKTDFAKLINKYRHGISDQPVEAVEIDDAELGDDEVLKKISKAMKGQSASLRAAIAALQEKVESFEKDKSTRGEEADVEAMMPDIVADHDWIKEQEKDGFLFGLDADERKIWMNNLFDEAVDAGFPTMKAYYIDKFPDRYNSRMTKSLATANA